MVQSRRAADGTYSMLRTDDGVVEDGVSGQRLRLATSRQLALDMVAATQSAEAAEAWVAANENVVVAAAKQREQQLRQLQEKARCCFFCVLFFVFCFVWFLLLL